MAAPSTVAEYLAQVPNPSPCPHSPSTNDPPCAQCIENRIKVANALRAGVDPTQALAIAGNGTPPAETAPLQPEQAGEVVELPTPPSQTLTVPITGTPAATVTVGFPEPNPFVPSISPPVTEATAQPIQATEPSPLEVLQAAGATLTPGQVGMGAEIPMQEAQTAEGFETLPPIDPSAYGPEAAALAAEGAQAPPEPILELSTEQQLRRDEIEAGTHPAVAPLPPPPPEPVIARPEFLQTSRNSVGVLYGWDGTDWHEIPLVPEPAKSIDEKLAEADAVIAEVKAADALQATDTMGGTDQRTFAETPTAPESPQPQVSAPAQGDTLADASAPLQAPAEALQPVCPHAMPATDFSTTPPRSAACVDCMNEPGPPPGLSKLKAERFMAARLETQCARTMCNRAIHPGEMIGHVPKVGWCCATCTKPDAPA